MFLYVHFQEDVGTQGKGQYSEVTVNMSIKITVTLLARIKRICLQGGSADVH